MKIWKMYKEMIAMKRRCKESSRKVKYMRMRMKMMKKWRKRM